MRLKGQILVVFIIAGFGLTELQAQSLYVKEYSGTQTAYSLSNISKISFSSGNLIVSQIDTSATYALNNIRYLNFADSTSVHTDPEIIVNNDIRIYPNPTNKELKIDLSGAVCPDGTLIILSLEGKLLIMRQITDPGIISVDISHLPRGTYICHFSNEAEIKSAKIIKQ